MKWRLINNHCCECPVTSDADSSLGKFLSLTLEDWHELLVNSNVFLENRVWFSKFQQKIWRWKESKNSCLGTDWAPTRGTVETCSVLKISSKSTFILFPKCLLVIKITTGSAKFSWGENNFFTFHWKHLLQNNSN